MPQTNLAYDYVDNIPWDKNPALAFQGDTVAYEQAFRNVFKEIPTRDLRVDFEDDVWDFRPYYRNDNRPENRIDFTIALPELREMLKFFTLYRFSQGTKVSTVQVRVNDFISAVNGVMNNSRHNIFSLITSEDIKNEVERRMVSPATAYNLYEGVHQVYRFIKLNYNKEYPVDIKKIKNLSLEYKRRTKQEDNKIPNIPDELFVAIRDKAREVMKNKLAPHNDRVTAAAIVILSQTGFRIGDLLALEVSQIMDKKLPKSGLTTHFIHYKAEKPSKPHDEMLEFDVFCNSLCYEAVEELKALRKTAGRDDTDDWLIAYSRAIFGGGYKAGTLPKLPASRSYFGSRYKDFCYKYLYDYASREWEGIPQALHPHYDTDVKKFVNIPLNIPETRQFRVRVCSDLYRMGVPLVYIQRFMGHLSEYMLGYYVRPKNQAQENAAYTAKLIREIEDEGLSLLGHQEGAAIVERIKAFISKGKYNVDEDMDKLIEDLGDKFVVRGKEGGVCIKTSVLPCSHDARTNEVFCAAGVCPNLYHTYYMIDVTYNNYLTLQKTHQKAAKEGRTAESKKEFNKIKYLVRNRLIPELNELDIQILKHGPEAVLNMHPELIDIIENRDTIRREAEAWATHKYFEIAETYEKCKYRERKLDEIIRTGTESEIAEAKRLFGNYIENGFVNELVELNIQIKQLGKEEVIRRHPEIESIVNNLERILEEDLVEWRKKTSQ